jgi:hypothetical protein
LVTELSKKRFEGGAAYLTLLPDVDFDVFHCLAFLFGFPEQGSKHLVRRVQELVAVPAATTYLLAPT